MPAKGKHRRPKANNPVSRGFIAAGTGGAAIALPLIGATGAHAAVKAAPATAPEAVSRQQLGVEQTVVEHAGAKKTGARKGATKTRIYTVVAGDSLSKIAKKQHVHGGWHRLYADNREAVGPNPSLIHPGLKLTIKTRGGDHHPRPAKPSEPSKSSDSGASDPSTATPAGNDDGSTSAPADTPEQSSGSAFTTPVDDPQIGTPYHASGSSWASGYHTGVDFLVDTGTEVKAVGAGTVVTAGWGGSYGNQIVIEHSDGHYSQYAHLSSISVSEGDTVSEGQQIGLSGATGNVTGPHLHFEIRTGPEYGSDIDPLAYLRDQGVNI
ncbi:M23 family metallopeptidase [Streptomyces lushanensis]|uniref:M23 family metallopeptidase n=1 Tax=Streptomyces lushanensis TaxID=1434255 RepID=UPI00082E9B91|nr:M23 family metallopeptidase [Streptomyces lushanensis]